MGKERGRGRIEGGRGGEGSKALHHLGITMVYKDSCLELKAMVTVVRVRIRLPYTDLVNEMHLENWAQYSRSEAEFHSVPLERRWEESGHELSMVAAALCVEA